MLCERASVCFQLGVCAIVDPSSAHSIIFFLPAATGISVFIFFSFTAAEEEKTSHSFAGKSDKRSEIGFLLQREEKNENNFPCVNGIFFQFKGVFSGFFLMLQGISVYIK